MIHVRPVASVHPSPRTHPLRLIRAGSPARRACAAALAAVCLATAAAAQPLTWQYSQAHAVNRARDEGKLILLLAGRPSCGSCTWMKDMVCEALSPPIRPTIDERFVPWFCDVDFSSEWRAYATGLGSFSLPMICCIDPDRLGSNLSRSTGIQSSQVLCERLQTSPRAGLTNPTILGPSLTNSTIHLTLTNLTAWATNRVERSVDLANPQGWTALWSAVSTTLTTNAAIPVDDAARKAFYRVVSEK